MPESTQKSPVLIQASHGPDMALPDPNLDMLEPEKKKRKVENLENHHTDITLDPEIIQEIQEIEPAEIQEITSAEICQDAPVMIGSQDASAQTTNIDSSQDKKEKERQERELKREQEKQEREFTREQEKLAKLAQREAEKLERDQKKKEEKERKEAERQLKKEALDKQREEKKKKLEEEKIQRAEERKRKLDEDRTRKLEEKKQKKEEEKKLKEEKKRLEEQKKLEDKNAKDRSQMKISSFFSKRPEKPVSEEVAEKSPQINTYSNDFLPFFQKLNVTMAKSQALSSDDLAQRKKLFYLAITKDSETPDLSILHVEYGPSPKWTTTDELVKALDSSQAKEDTIYELLRNLPPIKCLQFYENAKPPYVGTWCSEEHVQLGIGAQNPLDTSLTGYDYYYDSDLDWQDEEEGDDIDDVDEGEEDEEDGGEEEWGDFVDNNELTKRQILGPVLVTSTWNDHSPSSIEVFADMKVMMMSPGLSFPLDPKKNYWESSPRAAVPVADTKPGQAAPQVVCFKATGAGPNILTPHKPTIKDEAVVAELVKFIEKNNVFTVGTLAELAKREFKTYTKSILKHTIQDVAFYDKKENVWKIK